MKIILAFDSFKGSLTADEAVAAARDGVLAAQPDAEVICLPLADGGEGTTAALCRFMKAEWKTCTVHDPLMRKTEAHYAISHDGNTAIMEMAAAAGLTLLAEAERNPMKTTTYGVGEMMRDAIEHGCKHILIGIGGSATNDGGMGMLTALGTKFLNGNGEMLEPVGENLIQIAGVNWEGLICMDDITMDVICDVDNPLFGHNGAAYIYAQQKGASPAEVGILDSGLRQLATVCKAHPMQPGSGAAGGLGYGLLLLGGHLRHGTDVILDAARLANHLHGAALVITGEGKADRQTLNGKLPYGVMQRAKAQRVPVILLAGIVEDAESILASGFSAVQAITPPDQSVTEAMHPITARHNLRQAAQTVIEKALHTIP